MAPLLIAPDTGPGLFHGLVVEPEEARSILRPQRDERYGFGFALSPYRGCSHGCRYCYVREYPNALHAPEDWGRWVAPKLNAAELLWGQRHRLCGHSVFISTASDPYQPLEREHRLTRACLRVLLDCPGARVLVHTRSPLVLDDLELLKAFGDRLTVGLSIPTDDDTVRQVTEPEAPSIPTRWATAEKLARAGVDVGISVAPLMPVRDPRAFARRARESGAGHAWVGRLRLLKDDPFFQLLADQGWLWILKPEAAEELRSALQQAMPAHRGCTKLPRNPSPRGTPNRRPAPPRYLQQGLFEGI